MVAHDEGWSPDFPRCIGEIDKPSNGSRLATDGIIEGREPLLVDVGRVVEEIKNEVRRRYLARNAAFVEKVAELLYRPIFESFLKYLGQFGVVRATVVLGGELGVRIQFG
jgi:hypothetical protein